VTNGEGRLAAVLARGRLEVAREVTYDGQYRVLSFEDERDRGHPVYPGGDGPPTRGVCTDLVVRSLRAAGLDLQLEVHEDLTRVPEAYAPFVRRPDANIDHRRVGPLLVWLGRHRAPRTLDVADRASFAPGDIVVWTFGACPACKPDHIGLVSDRIGPRGQRLVLHNPGPRPTEDDALDTWPLIGHFAAFSPVSP
jgi:uncharacterized protein YijF (DUF1287 family)